MGLIQFWQLTDDRRAEMAAWVTRLGLDPGDVHHRAEVVNVDGADRVVFRVYCLDDDGLRIVAGEDFVTRLVTAPLDDAPTWVREDHRAPA